MNATAQKWHPFSKWSNKSRRTIVHTPTQAVTSWQIPIGSLFIQWILLNSISKCNFLFVYNLDSIKIYINKMVFNSNRIKMMANVKYTHKAMQQSFPHTHTHTHTRPSRYDLNYISNLDI